MNADSVKTALEHAFAGDDLTTIVLVKEFKAGDPLVISEPVTEHTPRTPGDIFLVKLNVGPGNPGPAEAPSTSPGIGLEIWVPPAEKWNNRVHALGGNGWSGGNAGSPLFVANSMFSAIVAAMEGAVVSTCDSGHSGQLTTLGGVASSYGDFAMNPDGTPCRAQWKDFAYRSLVEQAVKMKAVALACYGRPAKYAYFEGVSQGGRQGHRLAQEFPDLYDGIVANMPALYYSSFFTSGLYADLLYVHELGDVPLTEEQIDFVSNAAIHACDIVGGEHLGFIMDDATCRYDPTKDLNVLCISDGGTSTSPHCVTKAQAAVLNKIWYGPTADGSAPDPAIDNGWDNPLDGVHRWFGRPRGTSLYSAFSKKFFGHRMPPMGTDMVALELQDPTMGPVGFKNATGDGADLWKLLSYPMLAHAMDRAQALQPVFENINSIHPDLSAFKARGGKLLNYHGTMDEAIPVRGSIKYYESVIKAMGGLDAVQSFYKLYIVPGAGHSGSNGTTNADASPPVVPWGYFYQLMTDWVENGNAPDRVELQSAPDAPQRISHPVFPYPQKPVYIGGDPKLSSSFASS
jgi:feruloyl esterase